MEARMGRFEHGGDVHAHEGAVDFSANVNPLGMPSAAVEAICAHVRDCEAYPDAACRELRAALSRAEGVPADWIVCTAGASDLIDRACAAVAPEAALVTAPCFSGYEQSLERAGAVIVRHQLLQEEGFQVTERILEEGLLAPASRPLRPRAMAFLCNPNNPTGLTVRRALLERFIAAADAADVVVVLDECFLDFTGEPSAVGLCAEHRNLLVVRAFTKTYAMAGLRLGYGICSDAELVRRLQQAGQPWAVSVPAQVAGRAALGVEGWAERSRRYVARRRVALADGLASCGLRVVPGEANYLLFQSPVELYGPLLERGFLIRRCGNFEGLDDSWYRVAVRTEDENAALVAALREVCP